METKLPRRTLSAQTAGIVFEAGKSREGFEVKLNWLKMNKHWEEDVFFDEQGLAAESMAEFGASTPTEPVDLRPRFRQFCRVAFELARNNGRARY